MDDAEGNFGEAAMKEGRFPTLVPDHEVQVLREPAAAMKEGRFPTLVPLPLLPSITMCLLPQ